MYLLINSLLLYLLVINKNKMQSLLFIILRIISMAFAMAFPMFEPTLYKVKINNTVAFIIIS